MITLSTRQAQVLAYLRVFFHHNHCLPPARQLANGFGWNSTNAGTEALRLLEKNGALERNEIGGYKFTQAGLNQPLPAHQQEAA